MKTQVCWHCQGFAFAKIVDTATVLPLFNQLMQTGFAECKLELFTNRIITKYICLDF